MKLDEEKRQIEIEKMKKIELAKRNVRNLWIHSYYYKNLFLYADD